jgi:hypothetical protein
MPRTLLPIFSAFKSILDCYKKEEPETFEWLPDKIRGDYDMAKEALDRIPGSREWLKAYTYNEELDILPFCNPMGEKIMVAFGSHHSGASATHLGWNYHTLLKDWDSFVLNSKEYLALEIYETQQLTFTDIKDFMNLHYNKLPLASYLTATREGLLKREVERLKDCFNIHHDYETTYTMLVELGEEKEEMLRVQKKAASREEFEERIRILEHHYKYPSRWDDSEMGSSLFGSMSKITAEMMAEMERRHPGYSDHLASNAK